MPEQNDASPASNSDNAEATASEHAAPDLDELARKVVELLLQEIKLENERVGKI